MKKLFRNLTAKRTDHAAIKRYCEIEFGTDATSAYNMILAGHKLDNVAGQLR